MVEIKSLIDPEGGIIDRRIFADREIYDLERERCLLVAGFILAMNARSPIPAILLPHTWAKSRLFYGAICTGSSCLPECLPPSRQSRLPCRSRQCQSLYLLISRLDLQQRRQTRDCADAGSLPRARPRAVGTHSCGSTEQL